MASKKHTVWVPLALLTLSACSTGVTDVDAGASVVEPASWSNLNSTRTGKLAKFEPLDGDIVAPISGADIVAGAVEGPDEASAVESAEEPAEAQVVQGVVTGVTEPVEEQAPAEVPVEPAEVPVEQVEEQVQPVEVQPPAPVEAPAPVPVADPPQGTAPMVSLPFCGSGGQGLVDTCGGFTHFTPYSDVGFSPTYAIHWELGGWQLPTTPGSIVEVQGVGRFRVTGVFATLSYNYHNVSHLPYGTAPYFFQTCLNGNNDTMIFIGAERI